MAEKRRLKMAREAQALFQRISNLYKRAYPGEYSRITNSTAFAYAFEDLLTDPSYPLIDWVEIARMRVEGLPEIECPEIRYCTSLTLPVCLYPRITWQMVDGFKNQITPLFEGIRRNVYAPFAIRLILRAYVLKVQGNLPLLRS